MTKSACARVRAVRIALLGATAFALLATPFAIGEAAAKVGVTSATDGDPLGKPPQEAERVLRIGVDVQANELITTNANDRAHLALPRRFVADGRAQRPAHHRQVRVRSQHQDRRARDQRQQGRAAPGRRQDQQERADRHHHAGQHGRHPRRHHHPRRQGEPDRFDLRVRQGHDGAGRRPDPDRDAAGLDDRHQPRRPAGPADDPGPGRPQCAARRSRGRPTRIPEQQWRQRRRRSQSRSGRPVLRPLRRQLQPVGADRGAGRARQFRLRPGPAQSQSQRHDRDGAQQRQPVRSDQHSQHSPRRRHRPQTQPNFSRSNRS